MHMNVILSGDIKYNRIVSVSWQKSKVPIPVAPRFFLNISFPAIPPSWGHADYIVAHNIVVITITTSN